MILIYTCIQALLQACDDVDIPKVQQLLRARVNVDCQDKVHIHTNIQSPDTSNMSYMHNTCTHAEV